MRRIIVIPITILLGAVIAPAALATASVSIVHECGGFVRTNAWVNGRPDWTSVPWGYMTVRNLTTRGVGCAIARRLAVDHAAGARARWPMGFRLDYWRYQPGFGDEMRHVRGAEVIHWQTGFDREAG
jgi:hypothetical protein